MIARFAAGLLALACCAAAVAQVGDPAPAKFIGRKFWYEPEHAKYVRVEFHRLPRFDQGTVNITRKTRFEVLGLGGVFFQVRLESAIYGPTIAYLPVRTFRSRLYQPKITESFEETFRKSAFFEEDPAVVRRRLDQAELPASRSPALPPPWQIRNRGPVRPTIPEAPEAEPPTTEGEAPK